MLIIPTENRHRRRRELTRIVKKISNLPSILVIVATVFSVFGISIYGLSAEKIHPTLYILIGVAFVYTAHYTRAYYREKRKQNDVDKILRDIHEIAHSIRALMVKITLLEEESSHSAYLYKVESECQKILDHLLKITKVFGYSVDHICIKSYDPKRKGQEIAVVKRSDETRRKRETDTGEAEADNTFFKLLFESHFNSRLADDPELQKIKQNKNRNLPYIRYLAIGDIRRVKFPESIHQLLMDYGKVSSKNVGESNSQEIHDAIAKRSKPHYESQLGILISSSGEDDFGFRPCRGFIGLDSKDPCAWDFMDENHLNIIAMTADLLYEPLSVYNTLKKQKSQGAQK